MLPWVVNYRSHPRSTLKSFHSFALPHSPVFSPQTPDVPIEAPLKLWTEDPDRVGTLDIWTFRRVSPYPLCLLHRPYPFYFQSLTAIPAQRQLSILFAINPLRTLFLTTEGVPLSPSGQSTCDVQVFDVPTSVSFVLFLLSSRLSPREVR